MAQILLLSILAILRITLAGDRRHLMLLYEAFQH